MTSESSAKFVSYDLRPAKQCERKMMLDSFYTAMECKFLIPNYRYVGMGAIRFYDFIMMHKYLGIENMISLERDEDMLPRAEFNCPYKFINIVNVTPHKFISDDSFTGNSIYWMDYDDCIAPEILDDIASLASGARLGDFIFVTVCAVPPSHIRKLNNSDRLSEIKEFHSELTKTLKLQDMENSNFSNAVHKLLQAAFKRAFVVKTEGEFCSYFQVEYTDSMKMITYGGVFATEQDIRLFVKNLTDKVPFLSPDPNSKYKIKKFNYTERERYLFELAATAKRSNSKEIGKLNKLGFENKDIEKYKELLRYIPRYVETFV